MTPKQAGKRIEALDKALDYELFKALSDPTRVRILACLAKCRRTCPTLRATSRVACSTFAATTTSDAWAASPCACG